MGEESGGPVMVEESPHMVGEQSGGPVMGQESPHGLGDESPHRSGEESRGLGMGEKSPHTVGVSVCDSAALLWRLQDLVAVRAQGLVGALVGALPRTPRQNGRMGRPLLLLPEEEALLVESQAAAALPPSQVLQDGDQEEREEEQRKSYEEQRFLALQDRKSALQRAMTSQPTEGGAAGESLQRRLDLLEQKFSFPQSALAVQLSTARAGLSHCPESRAFLQADWPIRAQQDQTCDRLQVFRDLRGRGFHLTSAGKFGGDFLVYPGDPLRFHSHFIAVVLSLDSSMCLLDVLTTARLGSNVKKTVLLCSAGPDGVVLYTSLQWSGMV